MRRRRRVKITTYVPPESADTVRAAIGKAGAGAIGKYSYCSFTAVGTGRFVAAEGAHPAAGRVGGLQAVVEERIEVICERTLAREVVSVIVAAHPYEVVPVDVVAMIEVDDL